MFSLVLKRMYIGDLIYYSLYMYYFKLNKLGFGTSVCVCVCVPDGASEPVFERSRPHVQDVNLGKPGVNARHLDTHRLTTLTGRTNRDKKSVCLTLLHKRNVTLFRSSVAMTTSPVIYTAAIKTM